MKKIKNVLALLIIKSLDVLGVFQGFRYTVLNLNRILEKNYPIKSVFNFIQVGANDGVSFDTLFEFVKKRDVSGILIEPIEEYFRELCSNYSTFDNVIKLNLAVHSIDKEITVYKVKPEAYIKYPDWVKGIASVDYEHHKKTNINSKDIIAKKVKSDTLMNIYVNNLHELKIDYLQIDTEGFDLEVLKMIDFKKLKPSIIKYEHVNLSKNDFDQSKAMLRNEGYFVYSDHEDTIAFLTNKVKLW